MKPLKPFIGQRFKTVKDVNAAVRNGGSFNVYVRFNTPCGHPCDELRRIFRARQRAPKYALEVLTASGQWLPAPGFDALTVA